MASMSLVILVLAAWVCGTAAQSAHSYCSYVSDNLFECDYSAMSTGASRPIDFTNFSPEPQRLEVTMNGLVPYFG